MSSWSSAVAHDLPRSTGDIDLWVRCSADNADRIWAALLQFGAPMDLFDEEDFHTPGRVVQLGLPPNRIDILNEIEGIDFASAWTRRKYFQYGDLTNVPLISVEDLIQNKQATGRDKDAADAKALRKLYQIQDPGPPPHWLIDGIWLYCWA